jgi:peptidoglycan L-alanyl-D-glutamate endopeptidase CwlK
MAERPSSRNPKDLHPGLAERWNLAQAKFTETYPDLPQVFLTQTFRNATDQAADFAKGRTQPGKVVTNAKPGQSLHNYYPALAFDIAFKVGSKLFWDVALFKKFAAIAKKAGLEWGGDWPNFKDNPHFQPPAYTWQMAKANVEPTFPK